MINENLLNQRFLNAVSGIDSEYRSDVIRVILTHSFGGKGICLERTVSDIKHILCVGPWVSLRDIDASLSDFLVWLYAIKLPHYLDLIDSDKVCNEMRLKATAGKVRFPNSSEAKVALNVKTIN